MNGLAIVEVTDTETRSTFLDHEVVEFARMNAQTKKRIANAEAEQREADRTRRKAEIAEARRKAYTKDTVKYILISCAILGGVTWAGTAGMIHPAIWLPLSLFCLCGACLRLGKWIGKNAN